MDQKTSLYESHVERKGKMVSFAGYLLPVQYETGVIREHMAVRTGAGIFDVSHMGEILVEGEEEDELLHYIQNLVTNDCSTMSAGKVKYKLICNEAGGIIDDLLIYRFHSRKYLFVVNAANREKDFKWMKSQANNNVTVSDISDQIGLIALQGPKSREILEKLSRKDEIPTKYYTFNEKVMVAGCETFVSVTGYTGELGYEIYCKPEDAKTIWKELLAKGKEEGVIPCGLGSRDTLRLEAGMPLSGNEMNDQITPFEVGLSFAVKMEKDNFIGKEALAKKLEPNLRRVGIKITGRGIAREGCKVFYKEEEIGLTTSGTHCPYLAYPVAMALVNKDYTKVGNPISLEVRKRRIEGEIVPLPFYKRG